MPLWRGLAEVGLAAIQGDALAVDIAGGIAAQHRDKAADVLLAFANTPHGNGADEGLGLFGIFLGPALQAWREGMGQDDIGAYAVHGPLAGSGPGQRADSLLGGGVAAVVAHVPALGRRGAQVDEDRKSVV